MSTQGRQGPEEWGDDWAARVARLGLLPAVFPVAAQALRIWVPGDEAGLTRQQAQAYLADGSARALGLLAVGAVGWLLLRRLRARATERFVRGALAAGAYPASRPPVFVLTLALCAVGLALVGVVIAGSGVFIAAYEGPEGVDGLRDRDHPGLLVLSGMAVLVATMVFGWRHRSRYELAPLSRLVRRMPPPQPTGRQAVRLWLRTYGQGVTVQAVFFGFALLDTRITWGGSRTPMDDPLLRGTLVFLGPGLVGFVLLVLLLLFAPGRRVGLVCLRRRGTQAILAALVLGFLLSSVSDSELVAGWFGVRTEQQGTVIEAAGVVLLLGGLLAASVTCLFLMESGPQPWLGLLYLGFSYYFSYFTAAADASTVLPATPGTWTATALAGGYVLYEGRKHWQQHLTPRPVQPG